MLKLTMTFHDVCFDSWLGPMAGHGVHTCLRDQFPLRTLDSKTQVSFAQQGHLEYVPEVCKWRETQSTSLLSSESKDKKLCI